MQQVHHVDVSAKTLQVALGPGQRLQQGTFANPPPSSVTSMADQRRFVRPRGLGSDQLV